MHPQLPLLSLACTTLAALPIVTQSATLELPRSEPLRRVAVPQEPAQDVQAELSDWRARLSVADLGAREVEFDALVSRAAEDEEFRARLERWSEATDAGEFAWTCRLALREARARATAPRASTLTDPFEEMRLRLFGGQGQDPFEGLWVDPFGGGQVQRFRFGAPLGSGQFGGQFPPGVQGQSGVQGLSNSQSQSLSMEMGPDGVKVRVKKNENGQETTEEYSAKSMEELLEAHPELSGQLGGATGGFVFRGQQLGGLGAPQVFRFGFPDFQLESTLGGAPRTDRLGVYLKAKESEPGAGLEIEAVQPGSLAEKLGLGRGDRLLKLNGRELHGRDDISFELKRRAPEETLEVEVRTGDGAITTKSWTPSEDARGKARPIAPLPGARKV